jgi:hypothetical protein
MFDDGGGFSFSGRIRLSSRAQPCLLGVMTAAPAQLGALDAAARQRAASVCPVSCDRTQLQAVYLAARTLRSGPPLPALALTCFLVAPVRLRHRSSSTDLTPLRMARRKRHATRSVHSVLPKRLWHVRSPSCLWFTGPRRTPGAPRRPRPCPPPALWRAPGPQPCAAHVCVVSAPLTLTHHRLAALQPVTTPSLIPDRLGRVCSAQRTRHAAFLRFRRRREASRRRGGASNSRVPWRVRCRVTVPAILGGLRPCDAMAAVPKLQKLRSLGHVGAAFSLAQPTRVLYADTRQI